MVDTASSWVDVGIDVSGNVPATTFGPVWVSWHHPSYASWVERFDTLGDAVGECEARDHAIDYPIWFSEGLSAYIYATNPNDDKVNTRDPYPVAELTYSWSEEHGDQLTLSET